MSFTIQGWNQFGCGPRCLAELQNRRGQNIPAPQDLYNKFINDYPVWNKQPGISSTITIFEIAKSLGISSAANISVDPDFLIRESKRADFIGLLGFTERMPHPSGVGLQYTNHCILIYPIDPNYFGFWSPDQNGGHKIFSGCSWVSWAAWMMHGLILYK